MMTPETHKHILTMTIAGEPVPAQRPRLSRGGIYNPERYAKYKLRIKQVIYETFAKNLPPLPAVGTQKRNKALKKEYALSLQVFRTAKSGDIDNYTKTVMDALEQAGVIINDKQITQFVEPFSIEHDPTMPRIQFTLYERIKPSLNALHYEC